MNYIYFFRETKRPYVKIGRTNDLTDRFNSFKVYAPLGAYIVGFIETDNDVLMEKNLHVKYHYKRVGGEFFNMTDEEVHAEIATHDNSFNNLIMDIKLLMKENSIQDREIILMLKKMKSEITAKTLKNTEYPEFFAFVKTLEGLKLSSGEIRHKCEERNIPMPLLLGIELKKLGYTKKHIRENRKLKVAYFL